MATDKLIVCPDCGRHRRINDDCCPHCGYAGPPVAALDEDPPPRPAHQTIYGPPPFGLRDPDLPLPAPVYGPPPFGLRDAIRDSLDNDAVIGSDSSRRWVLGVAAVIVVVVILVLLWLMRG